MKVFVVGRMWLQDQ